MPFTAVWSAALTDEFAWWNTDTGAPAAAGCPPLLTANGGVFDGIGGSENMAGLPLPETMPRGKYVYIAHDYQKEQDFSRWDTGQLFARHWFVAVIYWSFTDSTGNAQQALLDFEAGIDRCFQRVQAGPIDKTHGWAMAVGEEESFPRVKFQGNPEDLLESGEPMVATIHYGADQLPIDD
jgi:hypothetical protein